MFGILPLNTILIVLFIHWVADSFTRSDAYMALSEGTYFDSISLHAALYTFFIFVFISIFIIFTSNFAISLISLVTLTWSILNGILHWIVDRGITNLNSILWKNNLREWYFVVLGFDQIIHYICLFSTLMIALDILER